jgi:hypothetical protein
VSDQYVVRARVDGGVVRLDIPACTYDEAIAHWTRLVELVFPAQRTRKPRTTVLLAGEVHRGIDTARECRVAWFDVRSADDPTAKHAPVVKLRVLRPGPGAKDERLALRRWGEAHGYHAHEGGWIYRGPAGHKSPMFARGYNENNPECQLTSYQGWTSFAMSSGRIPRGAIVRVVFRHHLTEEI